MVSTEEVIKLGKLSKLSFSEEELESFKKDLNKILEYFEQLNKLNLDDVEPLYNVFDLEERFSKDEVKYEMDKKRFLDNAPEHDDNFISLPKIVGDSNE